MIGGLPRLRTVDIEGPYNVNGVSKTPSRERLFVCRPRVRPPKSRRCARRRSSRTWRAARTGVPSPRRTSRRRWRSTSSARRTAATSTPASAPGWRAILSSPSFLYRIETRSRRRPAGAAHPVSDIELASRLSFFLWSSIPDETAAEPGRGRPAARARRAGRAGAPHDRGRARRCPGRQLHRAVAAAAQPGVEGRARPAAVPRFRRQHPEGVPPGDRAVLRLHPAREPQRAGAAERRLHVRRTSGWPSTTASRASTARASGR